MIDADEVARLQLQHQKARIGGRLFIVMILGLAFLTVGFALRDALTAAEDVQAFEWLSVIESGMNDIVFAAIAIYFLNSIPGRLNRRTSLALLHRMRTLAHVVDMHQLTKNPERLHERRKHPDNSSKRPLDARDLAAYLDYCSELLALIAKTAALFAEESQDAVVLDTVSEIETLTLGMSRKIWQRISLLPH